MLIRNDRWVGAMSLQGSVRIAEGEGNGTTSARTQLMGSYLHSCIMSVKEFPKAGVCLLDSLCVLFANGLQLGFLLAFALGGH